MNYMALRALSTMVDKKNDEPSIALSKGKGGVAGGAAGRSATATTAKQIQVGLSATEDAALKAQAFVKLHGGGSVLHGVTIRSFARAALQSPSLSDGGLFFGG